MQFGGRNAALCFRDGKIHVHVEFCPHLYMFSACWFGAVRQTVPMSRILSCEFASESFASSLREFFLLHCFFSVIGPQLVQLVAAANLSPSPLGVPGSFSESLESLHLHLHPFSASVCFLLLNPCQENTPGLLYVNCISSLSHPKMFPV